MRNLNERSGVSQGVNITFLGHAGLFVRSASCTILVDPWFTPAFLSSWYPFPRNDDMDLSEVLEPDYLYISHLHQDHFDRHFLQSRVSKTATVLLPEFPLQELRRELQQLGFTRFEQLPDAQVVAISDLEVLCTTATSASDGPLGDSGLALRSPDAAIWNQNDLKPKDLDVIKALGPYDAHFLQFSGAIWYPVVYAMAQEQKAIEGSAKRRRSMERAIDYIRSVGARTVFPCAGPACFLDDDQFHHNDVDGDHTNPFPDQRTFLQTLVDRGLSNGRLIVPGSRISIDSEGCEIAHPRPHQADLDEPFLHKARYLKEYQRTRPSPPVSEPAPPVEDLLGALQSWLEPLMEQGRGLCARIDANVLIDVGDVAITVDFQQRQVREHSGEHCAYRFSMDREVLSAVVASRTEDWVNSLFLSMRFVADRDGSYNEDLYTFFKCLSPERMTYVEANLASPPGGVEPTADWCTIGGWRVQKRCPHRNADLEIFGSLEGKTLTCAMHGWQFDLETGACLTAAGRWPITAVPAAPTAL